MENRSYAAIAAAFLIIFTVGAAYLFYWLQGSSPGALPYRLVTDKGVEGLQVQADVTYKGLVVGRVTDITLDPADNERVLVDIRVQPKVVVVRSMHGELQSRGVTGITTVRLVKPAGSSSEQRLETTAQKPAVLPLQPGGLQSLMDSAQGIAKQVKTLSQQLTALTSEGNRQQIMGAVTAIRDAAGRVQDIEQGLEPTLAKLPAIADQAATALDRSETLLRKAGDAAGSVKDAGQAGSQLAQSARLDLIPEMNATLERLQQTSRRIEQLAERLQREPQSLLLGPRPPEPGPGEPGFEPPTKDTQ